MIEALALAQSLIRCPSVTPVDAGALAVVEAALTGMGFCCTRLRFSSNGSPPIDNLYARIGRGRPNFCFAGHTDVVPVGEADLWTVDPFAATIRDGRLYGRGAADMKAAVACFVAAAGAYLDAQDGDLAGSISLLLTGDEEGPAVNGTVKVLAWLAERGEPIDAALVGEPTNPRSLGEMVKIGRRGSLNAFLTVHGVQGHAAYPHLADNPIPRLVRMLAVIDADRLDEGTAHFQPSTVTITSVDVGNTATNVIPARARATLNVRFNDLHGADRIRAWLDAHCAAVGGRYDLRTECSGEPFLCRPGRLSDILVTAVRECTGRTPELSTSGGTSDARFIHRVCPVVEFGMVGETAHQVDENVTVDDLISLTRIYRRVLDHFFQPDPRA
jgi:succinyl-diaminopimelate desuccinylase